MRQAQKHRKSMCVLRKTLRQSLRQSLREQRHRLSSGGMLQGLFSHLLDIGSN